MQASIEEPQLIFNFYKLRGSVGEQQYGTLILNTAVSRMRFRATSGLRGYQRQEQSYLVGKAAIPPHKFVGIDSYRVSLKPIFLPKTRGVEGNFYPITPYKNLVSASGINTYRGDFGVHFDANVVGTAGCVGITQLDHWQILQLKFADLLKMGWQNIPLFVPVAGVSEVPK